MSIPKTFGTALPPGAVGEKQVRQIPAARTVMPPIQRGRYTRNGQFPDVALINQMNEQTNAGILYRTKEIFRGVGAIAASTSGSLINGIVPSSLAGAGDRTRWRFAFHTGPYAHSLRVVAVMVSSNTFPASNQYARLDVATNSAGTPAVASARFSFGSMPSVGGVVRDGWPTLKVLEMFVTVNSDTDYYGTFYDVNFGRLVSVCVWELPSMTQLNDGYLTQTLATGSDILDLYRESLVTLQYNLWRRGGAAVLNWSIDKIDSVSLTIPDGAVARNIIDDSSTAVSANTPGYTLDMTGKERASQTSGVPCVMKAYGLGSSPGIGFVYLKDSTGATIATISGFGALGAGGWLSTTVTLPATVAKYDIHYEAGGGGGGDTFDLYAVSIYEYEP